MGEALKAWVLKQTAKAPVAPALSAWATFAQMTPRTQVGAKWVYLDQLTTATNPGWGSAGGSGYYPPTSQPAPGYSSTTTTTSGGSTGATAFVIQDPYQ